MCVVVVFVLCIANDRVWLSSHFTVGIIMDTAGMCHIHYPGTKLHITKNIKLLTIYKENSSKNDHSLRPDYGQNE